MSLPDDSPPPSHHLLRTLASVPVSSSVLDLGCGHGRHTEPLLRLGFPVHACDPDPSAVKATREAVTSLVGEETAETCVQERPLSGLDAIDESFDWIVADRVERYADSPEDLTTLFRAAKDLLSPGGWLFVTVPTAEAGEDTWTIGEEQLDACRTEAGLEIASEPSTIDEADPPRLRALYRRVEPETPA